MAGPRALTPLLVVLLVALAPVSLAQGGDAPEEPTAEVPVRVYATSELDVRLSEGLPVTLYFETVNLNRERAFHVTVSTEDLEGWRARVSEPEFLLEPEASTNVSVELAPRSDVAGLTEARVLVSIMDTDTGAVDERAFDVQLIVEDAARVLGVFPNPLPPPLDNEYGVFLLNVLFWVAFAVGARYLGGRLVAYLTRYAREDVTRGVVHKLRWPIFLFVFLLGIRGSFGILPRNAVTVTIDRVLAAVAVGLVGAYLAYRILDAVLYYYTARLAPRNRSQADAVLVPAVRKLLIGVLGTGAIIYVLSVFQVNLGVLFGAAGLAGLVLAFAAQETINNFLSGVFILVDRPFTEGDDIQLDTGEVTRVESIGLRSTRLYHYRNHELVVVPNRDLAANRVVNLSVPDKRYKLNIEVGVAYGSDVPHVRRALLSTVEGVPGVTDPAEDPPVVLFVGFGDSSLNFLLRFGVDDYQDRWTIASDVRERITETFEREGITIPFPHRTVWVHNADGENS